MDGLAKVRLEKNNAPLQLRDAHNRFMLVHDFCSGDLSKEIYEILIHNDNNMRAGEINSLFKLSGLSDVCTKSTDKNDILTFFGETDPARAHGKFLLRLEDFFERRNAVAHALSASRSSGANTISSDIDMLEGFGNALCQTIEAFVPAVPLPLSASPPIPPPQISFLTRNSIMSKLFGLYDRYKPW